ncbi:hypothetical protein DFH08DRAFT_1019580 [Mycena albidolilacea]|uniref:F-box domain-containing protein n=1 Tax=Mycena albidolilacea TaxID=1033008 RepID=A0AAD6ZR48_9AGAR|nr:hypothetical protein DFH08DRAFT_1019580 [Mycena albidolilacea]
MSTADEAPHPHLRANIRALVRSHAPPPPNLSSTRTILSEELEQCNAEITRLQAEIARLSSHRVALESCQADCYSLPAPIRRLPSELLAAIFALCRPRTLDFTRASQADAGMALLAQEPLLWLAQVCVRWHGVVFGTPTLWDTVALHASALWGTPAQTATAMRLLRRAFARSEGMPLDVRMEGYVMHPAALELIASHSERWRTAKIQCRPGDLRFLANAKGRLPLLKTLELDTRGVQAEEVDFLEVVPSLRDLIVYGSMEFCAAKLPLEGLVTFECVDLKPAAVAWAVFSLSRLSPACSVRLEVFLDDAKQSLQVPATSSDISSLVLDTKFLVGTEDCSPRFGEIFAALTLPSLRDLSFTSSNSNLILPWPHLQFLALSMRSSFSANLQSLQLSRVCITEPELLECLAGLPLLQRLAMWDRFTDPLLTDVVLAALTRTPTNTLCLVPDLRVLECSSFLKFDDEVLLAFLASRCDESANELPFVARVRALADRRLAVGVAERIEEMRARGVLEFELTHHVIKFELVF